MSSQRQLCVCVAVCIFFSGRKATTVGSRGELRRERAFSLDGVASRGRVIGQKGRTHANPPPLSFPPKMLSSRQRLETRQGRAGHQTSCEKAKTPSHIVGCLLARTHSIARLGCDCEC